jgi:hypothetical protein
MAQEDKELVTDKEPLLLVPPTTSLPQAEKVELPTVTASAAQAKTTMGASRPSADEREPRIEQRVDGTNLQKPVKPERKTPKNVMRIDDKNKRRVQPVAVIKAELSPWGYANRYLDGDISRPEHPFGSGRGQNAIGGTNRAGLGGSGLGFGGGRGGRRDRYDDDDDY